MPYPQIRFKYFISFFILLHCLFFPIVGSAARVACVNIGTTMNLNNIAIDDRTCGIMMGLFTHRSLTSFSSNGEIIGDLATSWKVSDETVWTFTMENGVRWHDGKPVTAHDAAFTYKYLLDKFPVYSNHFNLLEDVEALDAQTLQIRLRQPNYRFTVNVCGIEILPKHIFEEVDKPSEFFGKKAVMGCGPFIFESFDEKNGVLTFAANPTYMSKGMNNVDVVRVHFFKNKDILNLALRKGIIDLPYSFPMANDASSLMFMKNLKNISLYSVPNFGVPKAIFFNTQKPPVDNPEMRRALAEAMDYQAMIKLISGEYGYRPNRSYVPQGTPGYVNTEPCVYDPESSRKRLAELGFKDTDGDGVLEKNGRPLILDCVVHGESVENTRVVELIKRDFKRIGADFVPVYADTNVFQSKVNRERSYTLLLHGTTSWGMMSWAGFGTAYIDERNMGWTNSNDKELLSIIDLMNEAASEDAYLAYADELQQLYAKKIYVLPLFWNSIVIPYNNRLAGWRSDVSSGILNRETWGSLYEVGKDRPDK
jgi:peptide/nickel transport system substrate-binding protein